VTSEDTDSETSCSSGRTEEEEAPPSHIRIKDKEGEPVHRESDSEDLELQFEAEQTSNSSDSSTSSSSPSSSSSSSGSKDEDEELPPIQVESVLTEGSWAKDFTDHPFWERQGWFTKEEMHLDEEIKRSVGLQFEGKGGKRWNSIEDRVRSRHRTGHQAFKTAMRLVCLLSSPQLGFFLHLLLRNPLDCDGKHILHPASDHHDSS
jgi:hypothetical protein